MQDSYASLTMEIFFIYSLFFNLFILFNIYFHSIYNFIINFFYFSIFIMKYFRFLQGSSHFRASRGQNVFRVLVTAEHIA